MKFSVIIPIYNCEKYLPECLDSVLYQTFTDWECICVDDGSTDNSGRIADEYAKKDCRLRVVHQPNGGEGAARNAGLEVFKGQWVYFLDSDDILNHRTLEICAKGFEIYPDVDLSTIKMIQYPDETLPKWDDSKQPSWEYIDISKTVDERTLGTQVWAMAYKANIVKKMRFTGLKVGADRVFVYNAIESACKVVVSDYVGYGYRTREGSIVNSAMTSIKFLSDLRQRMIFLEIIKNSKKTYAPSILTKYAKGFTEYMGYCFFQMNRKDQDECLNEWSQAMNKAGEMPYWNISQRFFMRTCGKRKSRFAFRLFCYVPFWLKSHGVNRKFAVIKN